MWRGLALGLLMRIVSPRSTIATSTIAFALTHFAQGYRGPGLASTICVGRVFAIAAWCTGRLWLPVAIHALLNSRYGIAIIGIALFVWFLSSIQRDSNWPTRRACAWYHAARGFLSRTPRTS